MSQSTPHGKDEPLVLVVDDNDRSLKLARDVLRADGIRTVEATSGAEAVELAAQVLPDVILLDLQLPDMDGIEVVRELKARDSTAQIPVVALTAMRTEGDADWLLDAGFAGCLEKPITVRDFPTQVRSHWSNAAS
ncbi:MAG TPA: response regulator [Gaiellaceae bacterium]|nr:response regulator [Gaiellaceae bacterium]